MSTEEKVIKCKAAVAWEPEKPLVIEDVEVAPPGPGEVRVKIIATGVCGSDALALSGGLQGTVFPCILGHEAGGIVESVGKGVSSVQPGDHVIPLFISQCYKCRACKSPKGNTCHERKNLPAPGMMRDGTTRFTCRGKSLRHFINVSTFSQYTVVSELCIVKINKDAPLDKVCLIGCCISSGYGAAVNTAKVEPGSTCAIWGLGGVGLAVAMGCRARGAARIIGIDINPDKFETAKTFGVTECLNPQDLKKPVQEVLVAMTDGGCDYTFECIGNLSTISAALEASKEEGGESIMIGIPNCEKRISAKPFDLLVGRSWKGSLFGGFKTKDSVPKLVDDYMSKKLLVDEFITYTLPLDDINKAFDYMTHGKAIRSVIRM